MSRRQTPFSPHITCDPVSSSPVVATTTCLLNDLFSGGGRPPHRFELRAHSRPCVALCSCPAAAPRWWLLNPHPSRLSTDLFLSPESINDPQYRIAYLPACSAQWSSPLVGCSSLGGQPQLLPTELCAYWLDLARDSGGGE
jgi:hypothetical protein